MADKTHILYVEDNPDSRRVMKLVERIMTEDIELTMYPDSEDFESRISALESVPDLVLLDIHIEPIDGFTMLTLLRSRPEYENVPIIAFTASVMNEEVYKLREHGFNGVIAKPIDVDQFPYIIQTTLAGGEIWDVIK